MWVEEWDCNHDASKMYLESMNEWNLEGSKKQIQGNILYNEPIGPVSISTLGNWKLMFHMNLKFQSGDILISWRSTTISFSTAVLWLACYVHLILIITHFPARGNESHKSQTSKQGRLDSILRGYGPTYPVKNKKKKKKHLRMESLVKVKQPCLIREECSKRKVGRWKLGKGWIKVQTVKDSEC